MKNNVYIKSQLNLIDRKAMRDIRAAFGIDFEKPIGYTIIHGRFTVNQLLKTIQGGRPCDFVMVALVKRCGYCRNDEYNGVSISWGGDFDISCRFYESRRLSYYWRKSVFNDDRKSEDAHCIFLYQLKEYNLGALDRWTGVEKVCDMNGRFKLDDYSRRYNGRINSITIADYRNGKKWSYGVTTWGNTWVKGIDAESISDIIDKSGYLVDRRRATLKQRAATLRNEREKAAFLTYDFTPEIEYIKSRALTLRDKIALELQAADTSEKIEKVCERLNRWRGLGDIFYSIERIEDRYSKKEFSSVADFLKRYRSICEGIENLLSPEKEKEVS